MFFLKTIRLCKASFSKSNRNKIYFLCKIGIKPFNIIFKVKLRILSLDNVPKEIETISLNNFFKRY